MSAREWASRLTAAALLMLLLLAAAGCAADGSDDKASALQDGGAGANMNQAHGAAQTSMASANKAADSVAVVEQAAVKSKVAVGAGFEANNAAASDTDADGFNRKIVYKANITMEVGSYPDAQTALKNLVHLSDGYILQFSDQKTSTEYGGTYTVKVPANGFMGFLAELEKIEHNDLQSSVKGTDVTEEYVDLTARLQARQVVETRLLAFMEKATKADDLLKFSQELGNVQTEIEQIKGRMRYLDQNVAYSTIEIRLYEKLSPAAAEEGKEKSLGEKLHSAASGSVNFLYSLLLGLLIFAAGALPVVIVLAIIGLPLYMWLRTHKRKAGLQKRAAERAVNGELSIMQPAAPAEAGESGPATDDRQQ